MPSRDAPWRTSGAAPADYEKPLGFGVKNTPLLNAGKQTVTRDLASLYLERSLAPLPGAGIQASDLGPAELGPAELVDAGGGAVEDLGLLGGG